MAMEKEWLGNNAYLLKLFLKNAPQKFWIDSAIKISTSVLNIFSSVWLLHYLVVRMYTDENDISNLLVVLLLLLLFHTISLIVQCWYKYYYSPKLDADIKSKFDRMLMDKSTELALKHYEDADFYDILQQATECCQQTSFLAFSNIMDGLGSIAALIGAALIVLTIDPWLMLFCVFVVPMLFFSKRYGFMIAEKERELTRPRRVRVYANKTLLSKEHMARVKVSNAGKILQNQYEESFRYSLSVHAKYEKKLFGLNYLSLSFSISFIAISCYAYGIFRSISMGPEMVGVFSVMLIAIMNMVSKLKKLVKCYENSCAYSIKINAAKSFFNFGTDGKNGKLIPGALETLEFKNVSFAYRDKLVLRNVSFVITKGERIAIVGANGSGKTTLIKLLLGFYDVNDGEILYNGVNIKEYNPKLYRQKFSALFQDFSIFSIALGENIVMSSCNLNNYETISNALNVAGLENSAEDYQRIIGRDYDKNGLVLSNGQRQSLAFARMCCVNSCVAILDEPSATLDPISEQALFDNLLRATSGKTVLFISHRLSTATLVDRVFFLESGELVHTGCHNYLLDSCENYRELFLCQAAAYKP